MNTQSQYQIICYYINIYLGLFSMSQFKTSQSNRNPLQNRQTKQKEDYNLKSQIQTKPQIQTQLQEEEIIDNLQQKQTSHQTKQVESPTKKIINHKQVGIYADSSLKTNSELGAGINLSIISSEGRGSAFMKYTVYHLSGEDKNGIIDVFRRYNQFFKMRVALVKRFPGCFVPSVPDKTIGIKDEELVRKRQRYLNDFVHKMTKLPHLYNSEQFQALLRSTEKDLSSTFQKWPNPRTIEIINKYKQNFLQLAGKLITTEVRSKIYDFSKLISRTEAHVYKFKISVKSLAQERDKLDKYYPLLFSKYLPSFQQYIIAECVQKEQLLICTNPSQAKFQEHQIIIKESMRQNPYWLLYDLTKQQQRDGKAFLEGIKAIEQYENKKHELQIKISENNKEINDFIQGKKSSSQQKYKLQVENQTLKKQKDQVQLLTDIIIALVAFIQINRFKQEKSLYYNNVLKKIGGYEINQMQNLSEIWKDWNKRTQQLLKQVNEV